MYNLQTSGRAPVRERRPTMCSVLPGPTKFNARSNCVTLGAKMLILEHGHESLIGNSVISCNGSHWGKVWRREEGSEIKICGANALGVGFLDGFIRVLNWWFLLEKKKKKKRYLNKGKKRQTFSTSAPDLHNTFKWSRFHRTLIAEDTLQLEQRGFASVKRTEWTRQQGLAFVSIITAGGGESQRKGVFDPHLGSKEIGDKTKAFSDRSTSFLFPKSSSEIRATISYCQGLTNK